MRHSVMLMAGTPQSICQAWHILRELERSRAAAARTDEGSMNKRDAGSAR